MGLAWEWRAFRPADSTSSLQDLIAGLRIGDAGETPLIQHEEDRYLLIPGCPHSIKLRGGSLEVKWRVELRSGGYSLWVDKEIWPFPLGAGPMGALAATARRPRSPRPDLRTEVELIDWLSNLLPGVAVMPTLKERVRYQIGDIRMEVAHLTLPGGTRWYSVCVDGYDLRPVRDLVRQGRLQDWGRVMSYVQMLQEASWWLAATGCCEVAASVQSPRALLRRLV